MQSPTKKNISSHYKLDNLHILVVDDSRSMRGLVTEILKEIGVGRVTNAQDGAQAMKLMEPGSQKSQYDEALFFDIVISDWMMDPVTGLEFLQWVRQHKNESIRYVPFIMLTGFSDQPRIFKARDTGITEFLAKPISVKTLVDHLLTVIDRPRPFIVHESYTGPDRRRRKVHIDFPDRRISEKKDEN